MRVLFYMPWISFILQEKDDHNSHPFILAIFVFAESLLLLLD